MTVADDLQKLLKESRNQMKETRSYSQKLQQERDKLASKFIASQSELKEVSSLVSELKQSQ